MLSHEWRELETLCERISDLRHRFTAAQRTKNVGLIEGLKDDLAKARRQRELLVQHISARLSSVAADRPQPRAAARDGGTAGVPSAQLAPPAGGGHGQACSSVIFGFSDV